ncbi:pyruvate/oxaloacetate carboxyltransferase [Helicobacter sp. 11S02596-1]|uniref:pyruvate/oxaloacetate carboxyltransferase n=1 Tax=Helicobacter sp. 11S02596-1 TaxID=1476194 RepID=UPI000BA5502A|nr:pyruvate/oxaloacetate carboxyltransferase [Helicobacter sp. 11S02596-1]PAF42138.1 pyruvate carboxylase subunit B [Helicobacter sp. 11S02596-1]
MVKITENSLRDGHQSLIATRLRTKDMLEAARLFEEVGFYSVEVWGGATYDTCLRYLKEDPFERLAKLKEIFKTTSLQMLLRGQNLVGYRHYADDVVKEFIALSAGAGMDIFRVFDALNDARNLKTSIEAVKKHGKHAQGAICYTTSPVHSVSGFVAYAKTLVEMGCDSLAIKDMAGLLTPMDAFVLVKALKEEVGATLSLHTHSTAGFAFGTHLKALEAGVDILDLANSAFAEGTSHPCTQSMVVALQGSAYDSGLELPKMEAAAEILRKNRTKYKRFESIYNQIDTRVLLSQIPGGMISNLANQLKEQNALDKMDAVLQEIPNVRKDFGYPPLVTPSSQIVGTQAVLNVLSGNPYAQITKESKNLIKGLYGKTPAPISQALKDKILSQGEEIFSARPADLLSDELPNATKEAKEFAKSPTDVISYAMFAGVAKAFLEQRNAGNLVPESLEESQKDDLKIPQAFDVNVNGENYHVVFCGVSGGQEKTMELKIGNQTKNVAFGKKNASDSNDDKGAKDSEYLKNIDPKNAILSPMPGTLNRLFVKVGDCVKTGDVLGILEAMKMENEIQAVLDGKIKAIYVQEGASVQADDVLVVME